MREDKPLRLRDFVKARDCYFSVLGYRNDQEVKCFLRYVPDEEGERERDGERFRKLSHDEAVSYAEKIGFYGDGIFRVPYSEIQEVYKPEERLEEAMNYDEVKKIVEFFKNIPFHEMGVTGSRLIGLAGDESDVDFIVYGKWWFAAREMIKKGIEERKISEPDDETWDFIYRKRKVKIPYEIFILHERRKYHRAFLGSTYFDLLYVRGYEEIDRDIPEEKGRKLGKFEIEARVLDDSFIFDYPAYYPVEHEEIKAVLCFTHTFVGQTFQNESLIARGDIEVINGEKYLIVGSKREVEDEYILSLDLLEKSNLINEFLKWKS
jgi:hypothetical protein